VTTPSRTVDEHAPAGSRTTAGPNATFALLATALVLLIVDIVVVPVLLREQATDWRAYEGGARLLASGGSLYGWTIDPDVRAITDYPYLYPPPLAAIWGTGFTPELFAVLKIVAVFAVTAFAWTERPRAAGFAPVAAGLALVGLALASPPVIHDLLLGNVMTLYLGAAALAVALPGRWWAAIPIGIVVAIALKPAIAPFLLWMLFCRRSQFIAALAAGLATTGVFALILGPAIYLEYLAALPKLGGLAQAFSGNLGLSSISSWLAIAAIPFALVWVLWAARARSPFAAAVVAVGACLLAQPTLGLNYGALLIPGVVALWFVNRRAAFGAGIILPIVALLSPPVAGFALAAAASVVRPDEAVSSMDPTTEPA
jgi:hypothetical protein